jgi:hypothetical protein
MKLAWMKGDKYRHGNREGRYGLNYSLSREKLVAGTSEYCTEHSHSYNAKYIL